MPTDFKRTRLIWMFSITTSNNWKKRVAWKEYIKVTCNTKFKSFYFTERFFFSSDYAPNLPACPDNSGKALGFNSCLTAFIILLGGLSIALILFLYELISRILGYNIGLIENYNVREEEPYVQELLEDIKMLKIKVKRIYSETSKHA